MGCQIHTLNPQILYKTTINNTITATSTNHPRIIFRREFTCYNSSDKQQQLYSKATQVHHHVSNTYKVMFKTLGSCRLGISRYPDFEYDAQGGAGTGTGTKISDDAGGEVVSVDFDVEKLYIPPLSYATTKFLGIPLPPFLKIEIFPQVFSGQINQESGQVDLEFIARFCFSIGSVYKAPPLLVKTVLTSEESKGTIRGGKGQRLNNKDGICRLVGVATVEPINDLFMDTFLSLPTECLADLNASISLSSKV